MFAQTDVWMELLKSGFLMAILGAFAWAVWRVVVWTKENVVKPLVASHMELIDMLKGTQLELVNQAKQQTNHLESIASVSAKSSQFMGQIANDSETNHQLTQAAIAALTKQLEKHP